MDREDFEEELKRKQKEIRWIYKEETSKCKLCKKWRDNEYSGMGSYDFCVEHWAEFQKKREKEVEEWKTKNKIDGEE